MSKIKLSKVCQVSITKLKKNTKNSGFFPHPDGSHIFNMKEDIKKRGILVPLICKKDGTLLAGHSRLTCAKILKLKTLPVQFVDQKLTNGQEVEFIIKDNLLRRQLAPEERNALYRKIYKDFDDRLLITGKKEIGIDIKKIANETGLRPNTIAYDVNRMRHQARRNEAANRKVDSVDIKTIASFKKAAAKMLNAAMLGGKSTLKELSDVLKTTVDRFDNIKKMNEQRGA